MTVPICKSDIYVKFGSQTKPVADN